MDIKSRNDLVTQHMGLVRKVAYSYRAKSTVALEDLEQVGTIGLINAINKFDPDRGYKLSTYAVPLIRGEILHYLRDKANPIKAPRTYSEIFQSVNRLSVRKGISALEAAAIKNVSAEKWQLIVQAVSCSSYVLEIDEKLTGVETLENETEDSTNILNLLNQLPELEKKALSGFYFDSMSSSVLANHLGCDRVTAQNTVNNAVIKIKNLMSEQSLLDSLPPEPALPRNCRKVYQSGVVSFNEVKSRESSGGNNISLRPDNFLLTTSYCALPSCPRCGHNKTYIHGKTRRSKTRYFCPGCDRTFLTTIGTFLYNKKASDEQAKQIIRSRSQGQSWRSISKISGLSCNTVISIVKAASLASNSA